MNDFESITPDEMLNRVMRSVGIFDPTPDEKTAFTVLLKFLMEKDPGTSITLPLGDEKGDVEGELIICHDMPACSECGATDSDYSFQDPRFADGNVLCEYCFTAHSIEWERTK